MVKNLLTTTVALGIIGIAGAQTNLNFESWTTTANPDPTGWQTLNQYVSMGIPVTVEKVTTNPGEGTASAKVRTMDCTACTGFGISDTLPGTLVLAIPYTQIPTSFDFKYIGAPSGTDMGMAVVQVTKWNGTSQDLISQGAFQTGTTSTWTSQNVPLQSAGTGTPDSLFIAFAASGAGLFGVQGPITASIKGSDLSVDDVVLNGVTTPVGIVSQPLSDAVAGVLVYPNPASLSVNFQLSNKNVAGIEVVDVTGRLLSTVRVTGTTESVNTESFDAGVYGFRMLDAQGGVLYTGKFSVTR